MTGFVVKPIEEMEAIHHGIVKLAGRRMEDEWISLCLERAS